MRPLAGCDRLRQATKLVFVRYIQHRIHSSQASHRQSTAADGDGECDSRSARCHDGCGVRLKSSGRIRADSTIAVETSVFYALIVALESSPTPPSGTSISPCRPVPQASGQDRSWPRPDGAVCPRRRRSGTSETSSNATRHPPPGYICLAFLLRALRGPFLAGFRDGSAWVSARMVHSRGFCLHLSD
jgi:hypothetical protein